METSLSINLSSKSFAFSSSCFKSSVSACSFNTILVSLASISCFESSKPFKRATSAERISAFST
uniref:Uncharacterized protein n=1 Tax=Rhizophora mucronata TaxID=61149 RepID=A0A2P2N5S6_RHIMU